MEKSPDLLACSWGNSTPGVVLDLVTGEEIPRFCQITLTSFVSKVYMQFPLWDQNICPVIRPRTCMNSVQNLTRIDTNLATDLVGFHSSLIP